MRALMLLVILSSCWRGTRGSNAPSEPPRPIPVVVDGCRLTAPPPRANATVTGLLARANDDGTWDGAPPTESELRAFSLWTLQLRRYAHRAWQLCGEP